MSSSEVEMEDAEKLHDDSGNNIQDSECKVIDAKVECEEKDPHAAAALGDVIGREDGGEDLNECRDIDNDKMNVKSEVIVQTNSVNEASESIEGSDCGIINAKSENKEIINTETETEAQCAATSAVEKQIAVINEVVECEATNSGMEESDPTMNDVADGNHGKGVINTETDTEAQRAATSTVEMEIQINVTNEEVECEATNSELNENEPTKNDVVDGNHGEEVLNTETETEAQGAATSAKEIQISITDDVVEREATNSGGEENEPTKNNVVDGNHGEDVMNTETETEAQRAATSALVIQTNVESEVVDEATNSGLKENEPTKNDVVDGNHGDDVITTETETEAQYAVEKQIGTQNEVAECEAINSGVKENEPTKNDVVDGNNGDDVMNTETETEAQCAATSALEIQTNIENEVVEREATNSVVKENEPTKNDVVDGNHADDVKVINTETETEAQHAATSAPEIQFNGTNEVVECEATNYGVEENEPTKNYVVDGNHGEDVEKRPNEDLLEKETKETVKDADDTEHVAGETMVENADAMGVPAENRQLQTEFSGNKDTQGKDAELDDVRPDEDEEMEDAVHFDQDKVVSDKEEGAKTVLVSHETDGNDKTFETVSKPDAKESSLANQHEAATPMSLVRCSSAKAADNCGETDTTDFAPSTLPWMGEDDDGTPEDQAAFMKELEHFFREKKIEFKPPKFYGHPLNCLKLWRAVIRLGGYDRVTGSKLWRQVGESFHPPKTCTTVSWTFRIFYEKSLLEYERQKTQSGELQLPIPMLLEVSGGDVGEGNGHQGSGSGSGRARRDSAARAMQGWHAHRLGAGEVGEPTIKDKNLSNMPKNEKNLKSIGSLKQKRPNEVEHSSKAARIDISKQLVTSVVDVGPPADWVKVNVRQTKECFEVYALVPGLLREEVRVQSDPAGRLVITGQPEQVDNPWGITPFKKVVSLPARIDPVQTSAVVSLHGRLFVRVPLEQPHT